MKTWLHHHAPGLQHFMSSPGGHATFAFCVVVLVLLWLFRR